LSDFSIKQQDVLPILSDTLTYSTGAAVSLTGATVNFVMRSITAASPSTNLAATVVTPASGTVSYTFTATDTAVTGRYQGSWVVTFGTGQIQQFPTDGYLDIAVEENLTTPGGQQIVSLGEVKDYLNFSNVDRVRDAKLLRFIHQIRPAIEFITGPIIQTLYQNETYDGVGPWISLRHRPVIEVQSVTEYRGPIPYPLTQVPTPDLGSTYSYMFEPPGRIVRRTVGGGQTSFPPGADSVFVTYLAGYQKVPENVTDAACELIRIHFQRTQQGRPRAGMSTIDVDEPGREIFGFFMPNTVRERLAPNKRHSSIA
jgi:hypothetical protein